MLACAENQSTRGRQQEVFSGLRQRGQSCGCTVTVPVAHRFWPRVQRVVKFGTFAGMFADCYNCAAAKAPPHICKVVPAVLKGLIGSERAQKFLSEIT